MGVKLMADNSRHQFGAVGATSVRSELILPLGELLGLNRTVQLVLLRATLLSRNGLLIRPDGRECKTKPGSIVHHLALSSLS